MSYRKKHYPPKQDKPDQQSMFTPEYDNPGVLRSLPTSRLTSGLAYQRPVNERVVNRLIREWDEQLLEPLIVSFRDGRFNLVDGQHRVIALRRKNGGSDVMVLCRVYSGLTYEQEAELCFKLDKAKKRLSMAQSVNALLEAGTDPTIKQINQLLKYEGFVWALGKSRGGAYEVTTTQAVISAYNLLGSDCFIRLLWILNNTWHGDPASLNAAMFSGMALFIKTYETELNDHSFVQRLSAVSPEEIVRRSKADFSTNSKALRCAKVLLDKYNSGKRGGRKLAYRFKG